MKREKITVQKRTILGKKVKKLRKAGVVPANIYGKKISSLAVSVPEKEFAMVFRKTGETGLLDLAVEGEKDIRPVLIHNVALHPVTSHILHADFYQVDLSQKVKANIPIIAKGEAIAVTENKGVLLHTLEEVEIEALPQDLLERIEVEVTGLSDVDQQILVKDLSLDRNKVTVLTHEGEIVFKIGPLLTREQEEELKAEEAKKATDEAEKAAATAAVPQAGEEVKAKPEEKPQVEQPKEGKKE